MKTLNSIGGRFEWYRQALRCKAFYQIHGFKPSAIDLCRYAGEHRLNARDLRASVEAPENKAAVLITYKLLRLQHPFNHTRDKSIIPLP